MADAVIIDDGGSTRIKQLKGAEADGNMDDLIAEKTDQAKGTFDSLRIVFFDFDGEKHGPIDNLLAANDSFLIESGNSQRITGQLNGAKKLSLSLESSAADVEALVDAKQAKHQRRYIVANAGPIQTVHVTLGGIPTKIFDALTDPDHKKSVYTMVIVK
jgi:hypothetical protein